MTRLLTALVFATALGFVTAAEDKPTAVAEGKPAPEVNLPAVQVEKALPDHKDAKTLNLKDLQGKKNVVLFFYPKAMTKGCTIESCGFRDRADKFAKLDTALIGISVDNVSDQMKFAEKEMLPYALLADSDKKVTREFGVLGDRGFAQRTTFVIDRKGIVRKIYTKVDPAKHPDEVLEFVKENLGEK